MVKLIKIRDKFVTKLVAFIKHSSWKRLIRRRALTVLVLVVLLAGVLFYFVWSQIKRPAYSCSEIIQQSYDLKESSVQTGEAPYSDLYNKLKENQASCKSKNNLVGVGNIESTQDRLNKLQFYYDSASSAYSIGKFEEAKKDAEEGLRLNEKLGASDEKLAHHDQIIKILEHIRDGTY